MSAIPSERPGMSPLGGFRLVVLLVALSFLAGAVGWALAERGRDPLSATDVGFLQDMGYHHEQAVQLSLLLLDKREVSTDLERYAQEIVVGQRFEQGLFNAILDRFDHPVQPGDQVMGWMGTPLPRDQMMGLATDAQMDEMRSSDGAEAEALWIALISEHHLGGLHMADWEARNGQDGASRNIARAMVATQRGEVVDLDRYRTSHRLPIPQGFSDPLTDPRLKPPSLTGG